MRRVVIFGRGGAGKSTLAQRLGEMLDLPVVELDKVYWHPDGRPTPAAVWHVVQEKLVAGEKWILDGDLGPNDVVERRLQAADTIIVLDLPAYLALGECSDDHGRRLTSGGGWRAGDTARCPR